MGYCAATVLSHVAFGDKPELENQVYPVSLGSPQFPSN